MVLVERREAIQHEVGSEALDAHGLFAACGQPGVELGDGSGAGHEQRVAVGEGVFGFEAAGPFLVRQALLFGVEAHQAQLRTEEVAHPLCGQGPHVVGLDLVVPDTGARGRLHRVEVQVQRQHARRAQQEVATAELRLHECHARQLALREHVAVLVHHHPGAVEFEAGFD